MNTCKYGCGQQGIKKINSGEWICSQFPSQCPEIKKKNSASLKIVRSQNEHPRGATGKIPWNKGLTKDNSDRMKECGNLIKKAFKEKGHNWIGQKHSQKAKDKMSKTRTEMYIRGWQSTSCGKAKRYKYTSPIAGKISVDGKWELAVAKYLDKLKIKWKRNTKRFPYTNLKGKVSTYCPDFYIFDWSCYIEVKGYKTELDECKWSQFSNKLLIWTSDILIKNGIIDKHGEVIESG